MDLSVLRARYLTQPYEVGIETHAVCNARCGFCPYVDLERKGTVLPLDVIERLIDEMSTFEFPFFFAPFKVSEPLIDVRMEHICREVIRRAPQAKLRLFTNGQPLSARNLAWVASLPKDRVEHLWISLNSTDSQEYGELMGCSFSMVAEKLDTLHEMKKAYSFSHEVVISRVVQEGPRDLGAGLIDGGGRAKDAQFYSDVRERWPLFEPTLIKRDGWLGYVDPVSPLIPQRGCGRWFELSIMATGVAALCCMSPDDQYKVGSIHEGSLLDIYNQTSLRNRREFAITRAGIDPCARCTY